MIHHHYLSGMLLQVFRTARKMEVPQVYTYHMSDSLLSQPLFMRPFRKWIHQLALRMYNKFDLVVSPSKAVADELKSQGVHTPIQVILNPVSFQGKLPTRQESATKAGFQVLFAGRLAVEKNIPLLLRAFAQMKRYQPKSRLRIAGEGPMKIELIQLAAELGIDSAVDFLGHLDRAELSREYSLCDAFVLPSVKEVQAIVVLEAMRFGKPVIVTNQISSAKELVSENENGFIVDSEQAEDLAEKLLILNASHAIREKMGQRSLEKSKAFEPEHILVQLQQVYQFLAQG